MQLPKDSKFEDGLKLERTKRSPGPVPPELQRIHQSAVQKILKGLRLSLRRLTAILPTGLGDGAVGAQVVKEHWSKVTMRPFRVLVLVPSDMVQETEARYKAIAGDGLFVMRMEPGGDGTDKLVQAMSQCSGLVMVGGYSDVMHFVRAHRRSRAQLLNLLVCEMAHAALGADKDAEKVVMNWESAFRVKVLQSVFISGQSLEPEPIRGLEEATMDVPGVPTYKVVARPGGPGGPEVYCVSTDQAKRLGLTVPLKLVALPASGDGLVQGLAELSAWGIREVEAIPAAAGGGSAKAVEYLNGEVQKRVGDAVKVQARNGEDTPDALLVAGNELDPSYLLQALGRLSFKARKKSAGYILVLGGSGSAPAAAWRALSQHDSRIQEALRRAAVARGRLGRPLMWKDLPTALRDVVEIADKKVAKVSLLKVVNEAVTSAADSWDLMFGHLMAYKESMKEPVSLHVPVSATVHGEPVGRWVAQQFLEWRSGTLSDQRKELLMQRGLDVNQEDARSFSEGLAAFEKHFEDNNGDPYVPRGHFTENGFALGAWTTKQLVDWRMGRLSVEQQYLLWETKFSPAAHPENREAREITMAIETVLREAQLFPDVRKRAVFRALLTKYHPGHRVRGIEPPFADEVTQFLAGYREWFLDPPPPPSASSDGDPLGFDLLPGLLRDTDPEEEEEEQ